MILYTLQIVNYKAALKEKLLLTDTTVKSGGNSPFKPTWDMVLKLKRKEITDAEYTEMYKKLMRISYKERKKEWLDFLQGQHRAVIACYCPCGNFCHRYLLVDILRKVASKHNIPFEYMGELK